MVKKDFMFAIYIFILSLICLAGCGGKTTAFHSGGASSVYQETAGDYYLQPGDNLDVKFFYNPELNENVTIRPDGKISMQLIEEVQAAGLTPAQLDDLLTKHYATQLKQAVLTVIIKSFGGQRIYVGGEVNAPQVLEVVGKVNALQAIFNAGGCKDNAKLSSVIIVSRGPQNQALVKKVDLTKALEGTLPEDDYLLKPFDMVYVPKTNLAKADEFITHIYNFIPPGIGVGFYYELHNDETTTEVEQRQAVE
jgi:protein involved in polysaccharide export with SLBB domain